MTIAEGTQIFLVVGLWAYVLWIGKTVKDVKTMTDSIKNVFDSLKTAQEYFDNIHETARKLIDPKEVENVVQIKVEKEKHDLEKQYQEEMKKMQQEHTVTRQNLNAMYEKMKKLHQKNYRNLLDMFFDYYVLSLPTVDRTELAQYFEKYSEDDLTKHLVALYEKYPPKQNDLNAFLRFLRTSSEERKSGNALAHLIATARVEDKPGTALLSKSDAEKIEEAGTALLSKSKPEKSE